MIMDHTAPQQVQCQQEDERPAFLGAAGRASSREGPGLGSLRAEAMGYVCVQASFRELWVLWGWGGEVGVLRSGG